MVVRKNQAKLQESKAHIEKGFGVVDGSFIFSHVTLSEFAAYLNDLAAIDRPVQDKTSIAGFFDIILESAAQRMREDPSSIFAAVESVGLKLEPRKGPVEVLIVDNARGASEN